MPCTCKVLLEVLIWSNACQNGLCTVPEDCQHRQSACNELLILTQLFTTRNPADLTLPMLVHCHVIHDSQPCRPYTAHARAWSCTLDQASPFLSSFVFSVFISASDLPRLNTLKNWPPATPCEGCCPDKYNWKMATPSAVLNSPK
jgi:hypothetical protein